MTACLLVVDGLAQGRDVSSLERFSLFDNCSPMDLVVEGLHPAALEIGLTDASIQAALESRLRSARLYDSDVRQYLLRQFERVGKGICYISGIQQTGS